jgi:hypothetical protein
MVTTVPSSTAHDIEFPAFCKANLPMTKPRHAEIQDIVFLDIDKLNKT